MQRFGEENIMLVTPDAARESPSILSSSYIPNSHRISMAGSPHLLPRIVLCMQEGFELLLNGEAMTLLASGS